MTSFKRWNNIVGWAVFAIAALVYLMTMEPVSSLWDCSEFIATSYKLEVGHPPGAPLFMMLARLATLFAAGNPDFVGMAVNGMNSIASAFCILFLFWTITHLARRLVTRDGSQLTRANVWAILGAGIVGALAYTFTDTFWFSAIEGEVYALSSMFTALVVSRLIVNALYAVGIQDEKFYGRAKKRKCINFVGKKNIFFIISLILILVGPVSMMIHQKTDGSILNYSLEFSGGTATTVTFNEDMDIKEIDSEVTPVVEKVTGDKNVQPTKVVGTNQVVIKTRALSQAEREKLNQAMVDNFDVDQTLISTESISSTVSSEMRQDAFVAVVVATLCMLAYIWIRFKDVRFASSAVLALVHDVLVVFAFYALARISVGNTFIACMLTIVGYSINATIVIFDRIRENIKKMGSRADLTEIVNDSITQTLTRSIYTSLTTFVMVAVLYIMGVSSIREFALPLMVGIVCGAYSSVCITGSLWLVMKRGFGKNKVQAVASKNPDVENKSADQTSVNGQKQPKKKNRKRVAERLAAQEAEKNAEENKTE